MEGFFLYRLPDACCFLGGAGEVVQGMSTGFVISSFYNSPESLISIKRERDFLIDELTDFQAEYMNGKEDAEKRLYPIPVSSTSEEEHCENIRKIKESLENGEKAICCAVLVGHTTVNLHDSLVSLAKGFPKAFIFCFYTPQSGLWIGASPELLLKKNEDSLTTVALAGTRQAGSQNEWDKKNLEEQRMVVKYIKDILERYELPYSSPTMPLTKGAGSIEHLCTPFLIQAPQLEEKALLRFLTDFSPTPALCGLPKRKAYSLIQDTENFARGYYGGFAGPYNENGDFDFFVLLRAIRIEPKEWCMFAGGGITLHSQPSSEWHETRRKAASILDKMVFYE